ncbi:hypothetical protein SAMN02910343_01253 [Dialister histaminiformans]|uniref:tRNA A-37 threonylcarbamoyl transferase component Bud32 n=1 Tax=Allisonella histaminiformans TaxID=209880 RepID=A0A1G5WAJ0_9FIRM|nr:hypothetical protein [Allisonella histaminiformans]SDA55128.1 hypothetical protein SAMN02910343_01253 [Allisonella histaminiformans]
MITDKAFKESLQKAIAGQPEERNIPFTFEGTTYWIKRRLSNGRNQFAKSSVNVQFYTEVARSAMAHSLTGLSPEIVYLDADCMVTRAAGENINHWMRQKDVSKEEKLDILTRTGAALGALHKAGMTHGRPALRDFLYKDGQVTLLDWENLPRSKNKKKCMALDYLLLLLSLLREPYAEEDYMKALEAGYAGAAGGETREWARAFLRKHGLIGHLAKALDVFHMKDVEAFSKLYRYLAD